MIRRRGLSVRRRVAAILRDDFLGGALDAAWTTESGYSGWGVTGTGLALPLSGNYSKIARALPSPRTSLTCEASFTVVNSDPGLAGGVVLCTSAALKYTAAWFVYVGTAGWQVWKDDAMVDSGNFASTAPNSVIARIVGGQFQFLVNGTQIYSAASSATVYGIGVTQGGNNTATRCDWIEAR